MADTRGFQVVIEASEAVIRKALRGAWKSAECPTEPGDEGRIPQYLDVEGPIDVGGYEVEDGQVQIPQDELDAKLAPDVNGAELKLGLHVQLQIKDPPVPSAQLFDMRMDVRAKVPIGTLPGAQDVGMLLDGLPRTNVVASLTSGHPLDAKLDTLLDEFIHLVYENGGLTPPVDPYIPHVVVQEDVSLSGVATVDTHTELFDDEANPSHRIEVTRPVPNTIRISIPLYLRIYEIRLLPVLSAVLPEGLEDPMGIETRLNISAPFESPPGMYRARLSEATVTVDPIQPAGVDVTGSTLEGDNYQTNKARLAGLFFPMDLDALISSRLTSEGRDLAHSMGDFDIGVPTEAEIEDAVGDLFHDELESRGFVALWTPSASSGDFEVDSVDVRVISDALIIAINAGPGADLAAITNFIPSGREFAIALAAATVNAQIGRAISENGFDDLPVRFNEDGKDVDLNSLNVFLVNGAIRMVGSVTVIDAILGSIDVDADFQVDVGLHWEPNAALNADDVQKLKHHIIGDADVSPKGSVAFWIIAIILAIISLGTGSILIAIVIIVAALIIHAIAMNIGSQMLVDGVTGAVEGITAWPPNLSRIGRVLAVFHNNTAPDPDGVLIETTGLVLEGTMDVISSCETTAVAAAHSGGTYSVLAASNLVLQAAKTHGAASYQWLPGDGAPPTPTQNRLHTYAASGLYLAKHGLTINQPGGATSRHFALVDVRNVQPVVDAGPDLTVDEGEVVTLVGHFYDVEYPDTHESVWIFGDHQAPKAGVIEQTNVPPRAEGTSTVEHAWCDDGTYTVLLRIRDQNGGIGFDTRTVTVLNVPPEVDAGPDLYAYACSVITLTGRFMDPGWCDTHVGKWNFGDCTPDQTAIVHQTNDPPAATGIVIASHVYKRCGTYHAVCTVVDDDGGVGSDATVIRVVDVKNRGFEGGFRQYHVGEVANHWYPYGVLRQPIGVPAAGGSPTAFMATTGSEAQTGGEGRSLSTAAIAARHDDPDAARAAATRVFACDTCVVHGGQRAQRIHVSLQIRAGIHQSVGANPGWEYQISAWYTLSEGAAARARLGVDPAGGVNPDALSVEWTERGSSPDWEQLALRVVASAKAITIFLEAEGGDPAGASTAARVGAEPDAWFDDVTLIPIQPFCPEEPEKVPEERCVDFTDLKPETQLPPVYDKQGFVFTALDQQALLVVPWGPPPSASKLHLRRGVIVDLPFVAGRVRVQVAANSSAPVELTAVSNSGAVAGRLSTPVGKPDELHTLELAGDDLVRLQITSKSGEDTLFRVCAWEAGARSKREAVARFEPEAGLRAGFESDARSVLVATSPTERRTGAAAGERLTTGTGRASAARTHH